ncbi:aggrecan core protein-like isoform X10 [Patiria miniata]|uniref:EGF-like domain-containing protein n=1 Tax=Patiria miniata TaxID=46514 RepID=A0A914AK17_PATMI|nr:aggrecan core protein-like isoform X10 [Patiria miniata]
MGLKALSERPSTICVLLLGFALLVTVISASSSGSGSGSGQPSGDGSGDETTEASSSGSGSGQPSGDGSGDETTEASSSGSGSGQPSGDGSGDETTEASSSGSGSGQPSGDGSGDETTEASSSGSGSGQPSGDGSGDETTEASSSGSGSGQPSGDGSGDEMTEASSSGSGSGQPSGDGSGDEMTEASSSGSGSGQPSGDGSGDETTEASSSGSGSGQPSGDGSGNETTEASSSGSGSGQPSGDGSGDETTEASSSGSGSGQPCGDGSGDETTEASSSGSGSGQPSGDGSGDETTEASSSGSGSGQPSGDGSGDETTEASSSGSGSGQPSGDGSGDETTEASSSGSGSGQPSGDGSGDETTEASSSGSGSGQTSGDGSGDETTQAMDFTPTRSSSRSEQSSTAAAVIDPTMQASESVTDSPGRDSTTEGAPPEAPHQTTYSAPMVDSLTTEAARPADSSTVMIATTRSVVDSSTALPPEECPLTQASCQEGTFDADHCECACPMMLSGRFCQVSNPCLVDSLCPVDYQYCVANVQSDNGYTCVCNALDGYIMNGNGFCIRKVARIFRLRVFGINGGPVGFIQQFINPSSAASTEVLTVSSEVIFFFLNRSVLTSAVEDVVGIRVVSGGSIIVEFVALFPDENSAPTVSTLQNVLQETSMLDDGSDNLEVDTQYVTDSQSSTSCPQDHCSNGGSCDVSGLFPVFTFTCRCATSFTGEHCESVLAPATDSPMPSTVEPLTESATQDVSTVLVLVLVFAGLLLLVFILAILVCLHTLMRHRYRAGYVSRYEQPSDPYWTWRNDPIPVFSTNVVPDYEQSGYYGDFNKTLFMGRDEDRRMRRLHQVMSHSPYLQQGLMDLPSNHAGYYMATGHNTYYQENSRDLEVAGRVVRNPNPY